MRGNLEETTEGGDSFPDGKVRRRLEEFSRLRSIPVDDVMSPARAARPTGDVVEFAAGMAATAARVAGVELPSPTSEQGADVLQTSIENAAATIVDRSDEIEMLDGPDGADDGEVGAEPDATPPDGQSTQPVDLGASVDTARRPPTAPRWRSLGPSYMPNGQTYGSGGNNRVDVSGRVSAVAVDPSNGRHILVGAASGGIWETFDAGARWFPRTDFMPSLATGAIAFDPSEPRIVYAGTGEGDFYRALGAGVLRSTNGGRTWSMRATTPFVGVGFHDLSVDPDDGDRVLAATRNGIFESTDGGATWTSRRATVAYTISRGPSEILAATSAGLLRSTNGGSTWTAVNLPGQPAAWTRLAARHAPSDPRVTYVFASDGSGSARLWRRSETGNWASMATPTGLRTNQAWYDWFLGVSPDNPNQVFLGAINAWRGTRFGRRWGWQNITARSSGDSIHPDQHAVAFDPDDPAVIHIGNDGGFYTSRDRGDTWTARNRGLYITEIEFVAHDLGDCRFLFAGTQDNGSIRYTGSHVWEHAQDGDGGDCGVVDDDPNVVFHTFYNMGMERSTSNGAWNTWQWRGPNVPNGYGSLFYPPLDVSGSTVAQAGESIFLSRDRAGSFVEQDLGGGIATALHAATPNLLFVGMSDGRVVRAQWIGGSWTITDLTSPRGEAVSDVHVRPGSTTQMYATFRRLGGGRVFRSDDGGQTWTDRTGNLPGVAVNAVAIDPGNFNRVWVGCDVGVYESRNGGASWSVLAPGLPNSIVGDLLFHPHARALRAGTRNRGVWTVDVDGTLQDPIVGVQFRGSLSARQQRRWFTFRWPSTWQVEWTVMPTSPRSGAPQVDWNVEVERADSQYTTYWITVTNLTSSPVTFEGRYAILSRC